MRTDRRDLLHLREDDVELAIAVHVTRGDAERVLRVAAHVAAREPTATVAEAHTAVAAVRPGEDDVQVIVAVEVARHGAHALPGIRVDVAAREAAGTIAETNAVPRTDVAGKDEVGDTVFIEVAGDHMGTVTGRIDRRATERTAVVQASGVRVVVVGEREIAVTVAVEVG